VSLLEGLAAARIIAPPRRKPNLTACLRVHLWKPFFGLSASTLLAGIRASITLDISASVGHICAIFFNIPLIFLNYFPGDTFHYQGIIKPSSPEILLNAARNNDML
jgi:hypothetical protein